ncbi:MgtC/SapB family protein [Lysinibacter sp. HNR]|uniref:MgtC/SapB family protein n=1 Tax=Lysinibacter sp. HNR TaxID=3031408 RepID=UPI002434A71E|nr:MgtC/SapB family protein [Lysinibacter sp. HNR]WGD37146.1 MgtC/SapB family protein [Lysinibacter sp. HNR]
MDILEYVLRAGAALILGGAIGFERQWRARTAGLRTNALVSLGSALFVLMGAFSFSGPGADPTRVAAQVVSGIGFLGAGVIMKRGSGISGINTAATLWASAAVGTLAGAGMYTVAAFGTLAVLCTNVLLRSLTQRMDRSPLTRGREEPAAEYSFEVICPAIREPETRDLLFEAVRLTRFNIRKIASTDLPNSPNVAIVATLLAQKRDDELLETAIERVITEPAVSSVRWSVQEHMDD